jgi:WD40 repeat protein
MTRLKLAGLATALVGAALAQSGGEKPILRIEPGMHTAVIKRIGVDASERYLVTGSDDKTVRVWDLGSGRLLRVLRPPAGEGDEGKIYAVAMSPDGAAVACGGWTSPTGLDEQIYVFDRASGQMLHRITGLPNPVLHLAYSPDGQFLAAALGGKNGIRVFRTLDYALVGEDGSYSDGSYGVQFGPRGSHVLAATSDDGNVRLYNVSGEGRLQLISKRATATGKDPIGIAFSADGSRISVGYYDVAAVDVLSAKDLSVLYSARPKGSGGNVGSVAWSADGRSLYAGGRYGNSVNPVVRWADGGRGAPVEFAAANNTIQDLVALPSGGLAFGASGPAYGVLDPNGRKRVFVGPPVRDFRYDFATFALSTDGSRVAWKGPSPGAFTVSQRQWLDPTNFVGSMPDVNGLKLTEWQSNVAPKLNGTALKLDQYETSRSVAVAPDHKTFLLGTEWQLRLFDAAGVQKWKVPVPATAWAVNIAGNGQLGAAAFADGTIRWYRLQDGKELLALFPDPDGKRWVLWTPSGYYDASPGAEELIGWQVNRGPDAAADFYPVSRFRSLYYRPDVVARVLTTRDEATALRQADEELGRRQSQVTITQAAPPVVELLSPSDGAQVSTREIRVRYRVRTPSGEPVTAVRAYVDGRPVGGAKRISRVASDPNSGELEVSLPERDCTVSVIAENRFTASEPALAHLRWQGAVEAFEIKPKLYVLAVGVSRYPSPNALQFAEKDARDFANAMRQQKGRGLYRDVEVKVVTDEKATRDEIVDGLDWLEKSTTQHDVAMLLISGHGVNDRNGNYYYLPVNFNANALKRTAVAFSDIKASVQGIAGKVVFFVDTCHAGNVLGGTPRDLAQDINKFVNELTSAENGAVVFTSSSGKQVSLEKPELQNGVFTKALLEGLSGQADYNRTGKITINMLDLYISERVKKLTGGNQTPTTTKPQTIADFPIAVR